MVNLNLSVGGNRKSLCRGFMCLDLSHDFYLLFCFSDSVNHDGDPLLNLSYTHAFAQVIMTLDYFFAGFIGASTILISLPSRTGFLSAVPYSEQASSNLVMISLPIAT